MLNFSTGAGHQVLRKSNPVNRIVLLKSIIVLGIVLMFFDVSWLSSAVIPVRLDFSQSVSLPFSCLNRFPISAAAQQGVQ